MQLMAVESRNIQIYIFNAFGTPEIDLFTSRINRQAEKLVFWKPESEVFAVDAFSINWNHH